MPDPSHDPAATYAGRWLIALSVVLGLAAGIGLFTFRYANGLSYLSTDPKACVNCHIMNSQYDSWQKSSHHGVAVCVDCHLPHTFFAKYFAKAENGYRHSKEFTAQTFAEPIRVQAAGRRILQDNCVTCHADLAHAIAVGVHGEALECVHCHAGVGHGEKAGLGGPLRYPPEVALQRE
ncbi:MAG TPA: cytochrome c nitrite reductase small subunit [Polyangiales bacterium]|nr:cytochrome c nitrite reductase small subunit [Polyangiales bacterium]